MIKHYPITKTEQVEKVYSERDGVSVKYVCTTDFKRSDRPVDIFYRDSAHPEFGNRYFGIAVNYEDGSYIIFNADEIEKFSFGMVENDDSQLEYSQSRHDYKSFNNGNMIDGGRDYIHSSHTGIKIFMVHDGEMRDYGLDKDEQ